ncbi:hypothetical protein SGUI_1576 [Serinicoccus hydrothermalis]|uniref:Uncharacterized protein n=1 Tax=Serinicoccus hydrothermalis TaxID=1758689 RepID=A0A1B1NC19_9MICO|nr:hypothetical protein SGUI_1576 [Serinicoccus hydrothermalis]
MANHVGALELPAAVARGTDRIHQWADPTLTDYVDRARRPRVDDLALTAWFWLLEPAAGPPWPQQAGLVAAWYERYDAAAEAATAAHDQRPCDLAS